MGNSLQTIYCNFCVSKVPEYEKSRIEVVGGGHLRSLIESIARPSFPKSRCLRGTVVKETALLVLSRVIC